MMILVLYLAVTLIDCSSPSLLDWRLLTEKAKAQHGASRPELLLPAVDRSLQWATGADAPY